jgi:hypothetical protein
MEKIFVNINTCKYGFSYCDPPIPLGPWCKQFLIYIISESFHVNMTYSGFMVPEKIFKWPHPIFAFFYYLSSEEDLALYLNNLEFLLSKANLYQVWLKLASWFWRRFLNICSVYLKYTRFYYLPLEKDNSLHLNNIRSPLFKEILCQVLSNLVLWFWRRSRICKSLRTDQRTTGDQKSLLELSAHVS